VAKLDDSNSIDLTPYRERWVAIVRGRVVGVGLTREQAYRAAKRSRSKDKAEMLFVDAAGRPKKPKIEVIDLQIDAAQLREYPLLQETINILQAEQVEAYLVGGAVRDLLLRKWVTDFDFVLPGDGLAVARQVANALNAAFYPLDTERRTGRVVCQTSSASSSSKTYLDFAKFRGETLEADLADRDFTINAMALSLTDPPQLIDPWQGQRDLVNQRLRTTSATALQRDPVRVLRAFRQAVQLSLTIEPDTERHLRQAAPHLSQVSPERQRDELLKLLATPASGQAIRAMRHLSVLPHILPEVEALVGVSQPTPHHLDVFEHTASALDRWAELLASGWPDIPAGQRENVAHYLNETLAGDLPQSVAIALALLLHDTGKPLTRSQEVTVAGLKIHFHGHEKESAHITRRIMQRLHFSSQATDFVESVVAHHMRPLLLALTQKVSRRAIYRLFRDTGGATYQAGVAVALHALADHRATYPPGQGQAEETALLKVVHRLLEAYFEQRDQVINPPPLLTGRDLIQTLGLSEGQLIGQLLKQLQEAQAAGQVQDKATALAFVRARLDFAQEPTDEL
jgi:tRNA nucleotidyltransferase/poly(A) polymerase